MDNLPWLRPGIVASILLGLALGGNVARALGASRAAGSLLIMATGFILATTLTPLRFVVEGGAGFGHCDLSRWWLAPPDLLFSLNDASLNVVLFLPLGVALALLPASRGKLMVAVSAVALPFLIEMTQMLVIPLHRGCESADVIDNLTGLFFGWVVVAGFGRLLLIVQDRRVSPDGA
jgi:hypothetical protein